MSRFEEIVERLVEDSLAGLMGAPVQPIEMAKRLSRALEAGKVIGPGKTYAPNMYKISLHPGDFDRLSSTRRGLERVLTTYLTEAAAERRISFLAEPRVELQPAPEAGRHQITVRATFVDDAPVSVDPSASEGDRSVHTQRFAVQSVSAQLPSGAAPVSWHLVSPGSPPIPLLGEFATIGRALDNDIVVEDSRVSRYHAELQRRPTGWVVRDRRSTNGTEVNGRRVSVTEPVPIAAGDLLSVGGVELRLSAVPIAVHHPGAPNAG